LRPCGHRISGQKSPPFETANFRTNQLSIVNNNVVWVQGFDWNNQNATEKWSRSTDAGNTWTSGDIDLGNPLIKVSCIHAVSATTVYVSAYSATPGVYGGVWITTDAGANWVRQTSALYNSANSFPNAIHFWDADNGIVIGDSDDNNFFEVYTTANGGVDWIRVPAPNFPELLEAEYGYTYKYEIRGNSIWFGTNKGRLFISHDRGQNWAVAQSPLPDFGSANSSATFAFKNDNEGIIFSRDFEFYRSTDGGLTWAQEIPIGQFRNTRTVCVPQTTNTYFNWGADVDSNEIGSAYSTDGGASWINLDFVQHLDIQTAKFLSGTTGYCIAREYGNPANPINFYRLTDPLNRLAGTLGVRAFNKGQTLVTPNPTTGKVNITSSGITEVSILDVTGKLLLTKTSSPVDEINFDLSQFNNGIYFARLSNVRGESETVRLVKN